MKVVVLADENLREELLSQGLKENVIVEWLNKINELSSHSDANAFIDLSFEMNEERIKTLKKLFPKPVIINSINPIPENFIRINGWLTFLKRPVAEVTALNIKMKANAEQVLSCFNKKIEWTPDVPGFITARVVSMIINEAYFALEEKVSTKKEIDIAMKLGTNYPYGPFEWSEKIGLKNIYNLLLGLSKFNNRYQPASLLKKEATA